MLYMGIYGNIYWPLVFLVYRNDLTLEVQSSDVRLFADDTILYIIVDNPVDDADALNENLQRLTNWAK